MNNYQPLNCDLHDYLEIACLYGYQLQVVLLDGTTFVTKALYTQTTASTEEFLFMQRDLKSTDSKQGEPGRCKIRLDQVRTISPIENRADFGLIDFTIQRDAC